MSLSLILGCMFSGKSTEMIKRIRLNRVLGKRVLCINHSCDIRYGENKIISHDRDSVDALTTDTLTYLVNNEEFKAADIVCIEEAHFFPDTVVFVKSAVTDHCKHVIVSALDGDYKQAPFTNITSLIPFADDVVKLKALCSICKDGTPAPFTKRMVSNTDAFYVGGAESYMSVCRKHLLS